ncbi:hypothetical protein CAOG_03050 [Capsaspora owczarzaki ATCC 30864]|uniref:Transmembrane protein n=1 Tax=Capsaspora owczarzaki (strain ATCC 30864) TaxID=595528 RepID=A0A0D2WNM0_CAPO3|nr:hypothetical protein CAOG_03050 [Capsaspora owczarzaki ATCC 30864]KJE92013.1 hypothetical protein CAOG_003050 [Capsaspora owczarzaki ATCC 30864]|eukprot:XP_004363889.1 hypothetical protein CAOG_03050 [Capsaspora owczarzaki ATCC 30864]
MVVVPNANCSVPYAGENCDMTFGQVLGGPLIAIQATLGTLFCIELAIGIVLSYRLTVKNGLCLEMNNVMIYVATFLAFWGGIHQIDNRGWHAIYPLWFASLLYDICTSASFTCWLISSNAWAKFVCRAVLQRNSRVAVVVRLAFPVTLAFIWFTQPFATLLMYAIIPFWIGKIVRYMCVCAVFGVWVVGSCYFAWIIRGVLKAAQKRHGDLSSQDEPQRSQHSGSSDHPSTSNHGASSNNKSGGNNNNLAKRRRQLALRRIYRLNGYGIILQLAGLGGVAYNLATYFRERDDLHPPHVLPTPSRGDMVFSFLFDVVHLLVAAMVLWFFRGSRPSANTTKAENPENNGVVWLTESKIVSQFSVPGGNEPDSPDNNLPEVNPLSSASSQGPLDIAVTVDSVPEAAESESPQSSD